jgi:hypothetical protein
MNNLNLKNSLFSQELIQVLHPTPTKEQSNQLLMEQAEILKELTQGKITIRVVEQKQQKQVRMLSASPEIQKPISDFIYLTITAPMMKGYATLVAVEFDHTGRVSVGGLSYSDIREKVSTAAELIDAIRNQLQSRECTETIKKYYDQAIAAESNS